MAAGSTSSNFLRAVPLRGAGVSAASTSELPPSDCGHGFALAKISVTPQPKVEYSARNKGIDTNVNAFTTGPDGTKYAATDGGVYERNVGSETWIHEEIVVPGETLLPTRATAIAADQSNVYAGFSGASKPLIKSSNGGQSWEDGSFGLPDNADVSQLVALERENKTLHCRLFTGGLFYSPDGAVHWQQVTVPGGGKVSDIAADPGTGKRYAAVSDAGPDSGLYEIEGDILHQILAEDFKSVAYTGTLPGQPGLLATVSKENNRYVGRLSADLFGTHYLESDLGSLLGATNLSAFAVAPGASPGSHFGLVAADQPSPHLWAFEFGEPGATLVPPFRIGVTSLSYDDKSGFLEIGTKFGESPYLVGLDPFGGISNINCIVGDGNSQSTRVSQFGTGGGAVVSTILAGNPKEFLLTPTPFQTRNKGGFDSLTLGLRFDPRITSASVEGKKLIIKGTDFDDGAKVLLNGERQKKTTNDETSPTTTLIAKKAGKLIAPGETVMLQVQNADGSLSNVFSFTRPQ